MDNQTHTGSLLLGRLFLQLRQLERQPRHFGNIGPLTPSEIHTIDAIGLDGNILMNELAARLNITKGAVTQLVAKLENKVLVERTPHHSDSRATVLSLTDGGKEAYRAHEEAHLKFYGELQEQLSEEEIKIFEKCIDTLINVIRN